MSGDPLAFRVQVRVRNNLLMERRERAGITRRQLADMAGVSLTLISAYENIRNLPISRDGGAWKPTAIAVATALGVLPETIWTDDIMAVREPVAERILPASRLALYSVDEEERLALPSPEDSASSEEIAVRVQRAVDRLPVRVAKVIRMRMNDMTLEEVADAIGVSRERARQIDAKGMRLLRNALSFTKDPPCST